MNIFKDINPESLKKNRKGVNHLPKRSLNRRTTQAIVAPKPKQPKPETVQKEQSASELETVRQDVIKMVGYDVFGSATKDDQKYLYNDLISYLDEETLEDSFKLSVVIQIVQNNNQIRKIDDAISNGDLKADPKLIRDLSEIKQKIVSNNDKLAKENAISVKNRGDKSAGRSTLTYMLKQYRELNFDDAEVDYYDQLKAYGMKVCADISNKSLLDQLSFDENDYIDIINTQRDLVQEYGMRITELEEENRVLHKKIQELEIQLKEVGD